MKKYIGLALIFGWFFAFEAPYNKEGAMARTLIGPFTSETQCKAELEDMKSMAAQLGLDELKISKCQYSQEM
jgi:hypothetical protein